LGTRRHFASPAALLIDICAAEVSTPSLLNGETGGYAMKFRIFLPAALLVIFFPTIAHAQVTVDITKITCRQFLIGSQVPTKSIAIWFSGYYNGKRNATTLDFSALQPNADKLETYCGQHQDETLMKAVEDVFGVK
jgi:hypothetical protein